MNKKESLILKTYRIGLNILVGTSSALPEIILFRSTETFLELC